MANLDFSCSLRFPPSAVPLHLRSAFLLWSTYEVLRESCHESPPYETHVFVYGTRGQGELVQFMDLDEEFILAADGPHAVEVCESLPDFLRRMASELQFDEDGFCLGRCGASGCDARLPRGTWRRDGNSGAHGEGREQRCALH
jgi:hypothetical protein